jgi:phage tail-like protein
MNRDNVRNFTYLNREGRWRGHHWDGLEVGADGALQLSPLPLLDGPPSDEIAALPKADGPAGIAVGIDGTIFFSDPQANRVWRIDGCDAALAPAPCMGDKGSAPGQFRTPRGLLLLRRRRALLVADSGNHRIQAFDPASAQLIEIWGQPAPADNPQPGRLPGRFDTPWTLAADSSGNVYVVDYGNKRVQKFDALGQGVASFWNTLAAAGILSQPSDVAVGEANGAVQVYIVDAATHTVFVIDAGGNPVLDGNGHPLSFGGAQLAQPMGIVALGEAIYVGDNTLRAVLQFNASDLQYSGQAVGYQGPVAALAAGPDGALLVHTGKALAPVRLLPGKAYSKQGVFWTDAIIAPGDKVTWHRLEAIGALPAPDAHLDLFYHISNDPGDAPAPPALGSGTNPFSDPKWRSGPPDVSDLFLGGEPSLYLWLGAYFSGDGLASPVVQQMRVEFDHTGYLSHLPAIYQKPGACKDFLPRFLSLFETFFSQTERAIHALPSLFDPWSAPREYLPWLAGWLALTLDEEWDEATRRRAIAEAFTSYALRGTPAGLRKALQDQAGVTAVIQEPILNAAWWALPAPEQSPCQETTDAATQAPVWEAGENSVLGYTTMLAPAEPQGAVVGTTAVLDQSHVITGEEFGAPLFSDVAFQFSVQVYRGQVNSPQALERVRETIEQEKPAHTTYHLCVLEPRMRIGFQSRVGVDTVVAGPPPSLRLGETSNLGADAVLAGQPAGAIGERSELGVTTILG